MTETPSEPIRVLIADDHPLMREGLAAVIKVESDMELVGQACNGREAVDLSRTLRPHVTVMDVQMPELDGVAATVRIRADRADARVVILTTYPGDVQAMRALKAGASGYLLKNMIRTDLLDAIRAVHAGRRHIPREVADELAAHVTNDALTTREIEVLSWIAAGNSNKRVSAKLFISEDTVKAHVKNIMSKLFANDRTHAVTIALKRGIIDMQ